MKRKKRLLAMTCVLVALAVFSVSALAAVSNLSGYDRLKKVVFDTLVSANTDISTAIPSNVTVVGNLSFNRNEETLAAMDLYATLDGDKYYTNVNSVAMDETNQEEIYCDGTTIYHINNEDNSYYSYKSSKHLSELADPSYYGYEEQGITATQLRFIELLMDTLVGDTKNYIVSDGNTISMTLTGYQIPELAQMGLSVIAEAQMNDEYGMSDDIQLGLDARISTVSVSVTLDEDDKLTAATMRGIITGTVGGQLQTLDFAMDVATKDMGTTVVIAPDLTDKTDTTGTYDTKTNYGIYFDEDELQAISDAIADAESEEEVAAILEDYYGEELDDETRKILESIEIEMPFDTEEPQDTL